MNKKFCLLIFFCWGVFWSQNVKADSQHLFSSPWPLDFKVPDSDSILNSQKEKGVWPRRQIAGDLKSIQVRMNQWIQKLEQSGECGIYRSHLIRFSENIDQHVLRILGNPVILAQEKLRVENIETHFGSLVPLLIEKCLQGSRGTTEEVLENESHVQSRSFGLSKSALQWGSQAHLGSGTVYSIDEGIRNQLGWQGQYLLPVISDSLVDFNLNPRLQNWDSQFLWGGSAEIKFADSRNSKSNSFVSFDYKRDSGLWALNRAQVQQISQWGTQLKYRPVINQRPLTFGAGLAQVTSGQSGFLAGVSYDFVVEVQINPSELQSEHTIVFSGEIFKSDGQSLYPSTQSLLAFYKLRSVLLRGGAGEFDFGVNEIRDGSSVVGLFPYLRVQFEDTTLGIRGTRFPQISGKITAETMGKKSHVMSVAQEALLKSTLGLQWSQSFGLDFGGEINRQVAKSEYFLSKGSQINSLKVFLESRFGPQRNSGIEGSIFSFQVAYKENFYSGPSPENLDSRLWLFPLGNSKEITLAGVWTHEF